MGSIVNHIESSGGGSGTDLSKTVVVSNSFVAGDAIRLDGSTYVKAQADLEANAEILGIVESATGSEFTYVSSGELSITAHGLGADGSVLYLSDTTAGLLTTSEPVDGVSKPLGIVLDANTIQVINYRGLSVGVDGSFTFEEYEFTGDGSSINFDLPTDVASVESLLVHVGGIFQEADSYTVIGDGNGDPRRLQFSEAPPTDSNIVVRYLGVIKTVNPSAPVATTDYNSGTPVPLSLTSSTDLSSIQATSNFTFSHGLGVKPKDVQVFLRCLDADASYSTGDEIDIDSVESTGNIFSSRLIDSTNVTVIFYRLGGQNVTTIDKSSGLQSSTLDLSKWGVVVYANAEMAGSTGVIQAVNTPATEFESTPVVIGTNATTPKALSNFIFPHGLSQKPKSVRPVLVCSTADLDYSVGDEVPINAIDSATSPMGISYYADATNVSFLIDTVGTPTIQVPQKADGDPQTIDLTKWSIKFYVNSELGGYKGDRGPAGTGKIAQIKYAGRSDNFTGSAVFPPDNTIPQITEGSDYLSIDITPKNPDSQLVIETTLSGYASELAMMGLFEVGKSDAIFTSFVATAAGPYFGASTKKVIPANGTNTRTYNLRFSGGVTSYLSHDGTNNYGNTIENSIIITEILP